jgi:superfamily II DNA or RNA helicase
MVVLKNKGSKCFFSSPDRTEEKAVKGALTYLDPDRFYASSFRNKSWDGKVKHYENNTFKRGFLQRVKEELDEKGISYDLREEKNDIVGDFTIDERQRFYQKEALEVFFKEQRGIVKVPTRGGKTILAAEAVSILKKKKPDAKVIFLVDTLDLFKQSKDELSNYTGYEIGEIKRDFDFDFKDILVASAQTVTRALYPDFRRKKRPKTKEDIAEQAKKDKNKKEKKRALQQLLREVDMLIVDEVQEYGSEKRSSFINSCGATYLLCLSATPFSTEDFKKNWRIESFAGKNPIYEVKEEVLRESNFLVEDFVLLVKYESYGHLKNTVGSYTDYFRSLFIEDIGRNNLLSLVIECCQQFNLKTLVLFGSLDHIKKIGTQMNLPYITGKHKQKKREEEKNKFLTKKGGVLLATDIYKKGITLPEVEVLINAGGGKEGSAVLQRRGRIIGTSSGKSKALVVDIVDLADDYFSDHSLKRIEAYEKVIKSDNFFVFDSKESQFEEDLERFLNELFS